MLQHVRVQHVSGGMNGRSRCCIHGLSLERRVRSEQCGQTRVRLGMACLAYQLQICFQLCYASSG